MPPPGYRSAAGRATPTQPLVVQEGLQEDGVEDASAVSQPVRRRLLAEENHSPPDGPTDSPHDGDSPAVAQRIGTDESLQDSEASRLETQLVEARL